MRESRWLESNMPMVRIGLVALVCLALGCDPSMSAIGTVTSVPLHETPEDEEDIYASAEPIEGALVEYQCPWEDSEPFELTHSDDEGRINYLSVGGWNIDCEIIVSKPGYYSQSFPMEELCLFRRHQTSCHVMGIQAELVPR